MAGGDNELSSRTIPEDQNEEESDDYQLMFKHFKENKVEIASAITKPFPFLMSLRDRDFISEQKFQEYQETCKNLAPVERVVYDILSNVQKKFSRDLLKVIFSKTHLKVYPDLKETLKHFFLNASKTNDEQAEEMLSLPQCNGGVLAQEHSNPHVKRSVPVSCVPQHMCQKTWKQGWEAAKEKVWAPGGTFLQENPRSREEKRKATTGQNQNGESQ
uniref:Sp140 nuclear body protein like 1 n=2 Tax=Mus musculus TaxID=10090 RepID=E9Q422_MOUSE